MAFFHIDTGAPGLMRYGLHKHLSSESDDTDYKPGRSRSYSPSYSDSDSELCKKPAKRKARKRSCEKRRKFACFRDSQSNSSDSDWNEKSTISSKVKRKATTVKEKKSLRKKRMKLTCTRESPQSNSSDSDWNEKSALSRKAPATRHLEDKKVKREQSFPKHDELPHTNTWAILPTEILTQIFSHVLAFNLGARYLSRCMQVCQNWYEIASQSIAWQGSADLSFLGGHEVATDKLLVDLSTSRLMELKGLNLCGWRQLTSVGVASVAEHCRKLEFLNISNCQKKISKITADNILQLAENTNLKRINFSNLRLMNYGKTLVGFIKTRGLHLTHLYCSENIALGSAVMTGICSHCPNLEVLDLSNTSVRNICFTTFQKSCRKLRELYLANLSLEVKPFAIETNESDNPGFPDLISLSVAGSQRFTNWFTDNLVQVVLRKSDKLRTLDIRGNNSITHVGLNIPSNNIERLFMSRTNISSKTIEVICRKWNHCLWDLDLSWADPYGIPFDHLVSQLVVGDGACKKLCTLNLAGTSVTDVAVESVLSSCASLESIDLSSCRGVTRGYKRFHDGVDAIQTLRRFYNVYLESREDEVVE